MHYTFVKRFLLFSLLGIFLVISFNYVVDPFNIHQPASKSFSLVKPNASTRLSKAWNTIRHKPKTIVLGTSRSIHINPEKWENIDEGPFYNAGFSGASFDEIYDYFLHALYVQPDLKRVFLGIDLFSFNSKRKPQVDFKGERLQTNHFELDDIKEVLLSYRALIHSFADVCNIFFEVGEKNPIKEMGGDSVYLQQMLSSNEFYKDYTIGMDKINKFQNLVEICKECSIELHVFVCPVKAQYWEFYYQNDLWLPLENLKRLLCAFHPLWDFSGYNPITLETLESEGEALYHECSHFTVYTGNLLVKRMLGQPSSIDSIGYLLFPENVDQTLVKILEQRSQWLLKENMNLITRTLSIVN